MVLMGENHLIAVVSEMQKLSAFFLWSRLTKTNKTWEIPHIPDSSYSELITFY